MQNSSALFIYFIIFYSVNALSSTNSGLKYLLSTLDHARTNHAFSYIFFSILSIGVLAAGSFISSRLNLLAFCSSSYSSTPLLIPNNVRTGVDNPPKMMTEIQHFHKFPYIWLTRDDDTVGVFYTEAGDYVIEHRESQGSWMVWHQIGFEERDLTIEVIMKKVMGVEDSFYGVMWNVIDISNFNYFIISPNGYYQIGVSRSGRWQAYADWLQTSLIKQSNRSNRLKIHVGDQDISFEINGGFVGTFSKHYFHQGHTTVGFLVGRIMKVMVVASSIRWEHHTEFADFLFESDYAEFRDDVNEDEFYTEAIEKGYTSTYDMYDPDLYDFHTRREMSLKDTL